MLGFSAQPTFAGKKSHMPYSVACLRRIEIMIVKLSVLICCIAFVSSASAQNIAPKEQLPGWAQNRWKDVAKRESLEISTRLNPFVWRGNFDVRGQGDLAILVRHTKSKKEGILFLLRSGRVTHVLGAGTPFGNGGDDFSWIDFWYVEDIGSLQRSYNEKSVKLNVDGLIVAKEESASALIYIRDGKAHWQQQGD
jgi:hypothetical protein